MTLDGKDLGLNPGITTWWLCDPGQATSSSKPPSPHQQRDNDSNTRFRGLS